MSNRPAWTHEDAATRATRDNGATSSKPSRNKPTADTRMAATELAAVRRSRAISSNSKDISSQAETRDIAATREMLGDRTRGVETTPVTREVIREATLAILEATCAIPGEILAILEVTLGAIPEVTLATHEPDEGRQHRLDRRDREDRRAWAWAWTWPGRIPTCGLRRTSSRVTEQPSSPSRRRLGRRSGRGRCSASCARVTM